MDAMRVLHIKGTLGPDGATMVEYSLARELRGRVIADWLLDSAPAEAWKARFEQLGGRVEQMRLPGGGNKILKVWRKYRAWRNWFRAHPCETVHIDTDGFHRTVELFAARRAGVPRRIVHSHNTEAEVAGRLGGSGLSRRVGQWLYNRLATDCLACSDAAGEWLFGRGGRRGVRLIRNGLDTEKFRFNPETRAEKRRELGAGESLLLGHVGRFEAQKNHRFLLEIFRRVYTENPAAKLLLIGTGSLQEEIKQAARDAGVQDAVIFLGATDNPGAYYQAMDLFLMPSLHEGLPLTAVEAQASGLPCLLSDRISRQAALGTGCEFLPIDRGPDPWAEAVRKAAAAPRSREKGAAEIIAAGYDIRSSAEELLAVYQRKGPANAVLH